MLTRAFEAGVNHDDVWSMTLVEISFIIEGYQSRLKRISDMNTVAAWLTAKLSRARRIPTVDYLLRGGSNSKARVLPPDEASEQLSRHKDLVKSIAPDAEATDSALLNFISRKSSEVPSEQSA